MEGIQTMKRMDKQAACWFLAGIPVIIVVGTLLHFVYDWSGQSMVVGIFAPVNESIWEHQKLIVWPTLVWCFAGYLLKRKEGVSASRWFSSCAVGLYAGPLFIISFYYTYTGALGIHSLVLDILSFILGVITAQLIMLHFYQYANKSRLALPCSCFAILILIGALVLFTFYPPQLPIFMDPVTGEYGITSALSIM